LIRYNLWRYTLWNIGFVTSPETSQKTGVPGKTVITFAYRLQIPWDHFHWKEYGLHFLLCKFQNHILNIERGACCTSGVF
jgi:hypothetical protein